MELNQKKHILKESTTMENLLETKFVIENCSLGQRLAIKAYCDEKKIKYFPGLLDDLQYPIIKYELHDKCFHGSLYAYEHRNQITFSELIQFLDKYQPEPEFKVGDFVKTIQTGGNVSQSKFWSHSYVKRNEILEITGFINELNCGKVAICKGGYVIYLDTAIKYVKHATPEEIKKWKEENEIKLPTINNQKGEVHSNFINFGCAKFNKEFFLSLASLDNEEGNRSIKSIELNSGVKIQIGEIQQIKKFIEHNKL